LDHSVAVEWSQPIGQLSLASLRGR